MKFSSFALGSTLGFLAMIAAVLGLAITLALIASAFAVTGYPPINGPALQDGVWLNGLAGGLNNSYQYGITAAGTTQAGATALPLGIWLNEVDTAAASSGVSLPECNQGQQLYLYNNGASTLTVYPNPTNNPATSAQDTINNTTSVSVTSHTAEIFFCAKNGVWAAK